MKKNWFYLTFSLLVMLLTSCNNNDEIYIPQEVQFNVNYSFTHNGDMTRSVNSEETYTKFYDEYIKTKILTPKNYTLTFTNKDKNTVVTVNGMWDNKDGIRLIEGEYNVSGTSHPLDCPSDTVFLKFDETIKITKDMTSLKLTAKYDSYLIMFDTENIKEIYQTCSNTHYKHNLRKNNVYTIFDTNPTCHDHYPSAASPSDIIKIKRNDDKLITIYLNNFSFEKGKYYYFNDMTNSFDIPTMENGN